MVGSRQNSLTSVLRDAWVEIDLSAIEFNVEVIKAWLARNEEPAKLMAVVKSDAYGHGATQISEVLVNSGASFLGVASLDEGKQIRMAGIKTPTLILSPSPIWALDSAIENDLDLTISSVNQLKAIESAAKKCEKPASVHIKVDTGMHRLGMEILKFADVLDYVESAKSLRLKSVFSHLALASDKEAVDYQFDKFKEVFSNFKNRKQVDFHLASSEAVESFEKTHLDMVRVGLYLYGLRPRVESGNLKPAMSVKARIINIINVPEGEKAGYNWTWTAKRPSRLASIPIGYADGVARELSNNLNGFLMGKEIKQAGIISMDQMLFDITDVPEAEEGDVVTLIGKDDKLKNRELTIASWASKLDTITYELVCRLRARLPRIYTRVRRKFDTRNL